MGNQHLQLDASGHLRLHGSGHLKLKRTYAVDWYAAYKCDSGLQYTELYAGSDQGWLPTQAAVNTYWGSVISAMRAATRSSVDSSYSPLLRAYYQSNGWNGNNIKLKGQAICHGVIWRVTPSDGSMGSAPAIIPSVGVTRSGYTPTDVSPAGPVIVGTGAAAPSGCPDQWSANLWSGGSTTLTDVEVLEYIWAAVAFTSYSPAPSVTGYTWARGESGQHLGFSGTVYD